MTMKTTMSSEIVPTFLLMALLMGCNVIIEAHAGSSQSGSVYCRKTDCEYVKDVLDWKNATAVGVFNDTLLVTGWGTLDIKAGYATGQTSTNAEIMFAAGYLEGILTAQQIYNQYLNFKTVIPLDAQLKVKVQNWFRKQREWADNMIENNPDDPIWRHMSYILAQFDGLIAGYKKAHHDVQDVDPVFVMSFLNAYGDLLDLVKILEPSRIKDWTKFTPAEAEHYFYHSGHCSVLIKALPGYENIFMSHSTWFAYQITNRIYKHYNFNVNDPATASKKVSFSSYPGSLESLDDFYHMGSGMVMLQTTNLIFNTSLYKLCTPQSLLAWQRVLVANMMAHGGREWTDIISKYNSGTYNNQYMVVDLKLIKLQSDLPDNTLWVAEQIPGLVVAQDLTPILREGYFPSYNIPFFEEIYNKSGYLGFAKLHGNQYTYQLASRAKIFRRDSSKVTDMDSMKKLMRYSDFLHEPYSGGNPFGIICARGDYEKVTISTSGCFDTKVSDVAMARVLEADIISGPSVNPDMPPFSWTGKFANLSHVGLPETYNFSFINTQPRWSSTDIQL